MTDKKDAELYRDPYRALSRWDNEGGAQTEEDNRTSEYPHIGNAELVQLRVRVIALENIVLALLSESPDKTHEKVRALADIGSDRAGCGIIRPIIPAGFPYCRRDQRI